MNFFKKIVLGIVFFSLLLTPGLFGSVKNIKAETSIKDLAARTRGFTCYTTITEAEIKQAKEMGVNTMRLMLMIHDLHNLTYYDQVPSSKIAPEKIDKIKTILKWTKKYGLTLIIDVHEVPGLVRFSGWKDFRLWDGEFGYKYQDLLVDTWKQLANEFKNEHPRVIIFELLNEPEPKENDWNAKEDRGYLWDKLQLRLFQEIRKIDKTHTLVVAPPYSWRVNSLVGWNLPKEIAQDGKIMLAVHMYHPHDYTIQWLPWIDSKMSPKAYPGEFFDNSWEGILSYWDKKKITETLKPIVDFQKKYPNVPVIVTEFSVIRIAPGADQYLKDLTDLFFQLNIGWTYHVFKESEYFLKTKGIKSLSMWDLEVSPPYRFNVIKNAFRNIKK